MEKSFRQLKQELASCDDPIKERVIRKLMLLKYNKKMASKPKVDIDISDIDVTEFQAQPNETPDKMKETLNKNVLSRLDACADIYKKSASKKPTDCLPPYINDSGDKYASFEEAFSNKLTSFIQQDDKR